MKNLFLTINSYLLVFLLVALTSCEKGFEELNENPYAPTQVNIGPLFNDIIFSLRLGINRQFYLHNETLYGVTQLAALTASTFQNINIGTEDAWENYYKALSNARALEQRFEEHPGDPEALTNVRAQLKIIMAYKTLQLCDLFGDIPYFQAGLAFEDLDNIRPPFDDQETIYKTMLDDLRWASENIVNEGNPMTASGESFVSFGNFDTFFQNNWTNWIKFSNSLQLRHLLRMVEKDPDFVAPRIAQMIQEGASFLVEGDDVYMHPAEQDWQNWGLNWSFREHNKLRMGSNLWNFMTDAGEVIDPRAYIFFETNNADEWIPFPQQPTIDTPQSGGQPYFNGRRDQSYTDKGEGNIYSNFNYYLVRDEYDIPEIIMTAAEVKFLLAEVFIRGIGVNQDFANAEFNYLLGLSASQNFWQNLMLDSPIWVNKIQVLTTGELFSVSDHPRYNFQMAADESAKLDLIYAQRWVDHFRQPWEAFALLRRTGDRVPREGAANDFFRFKYPPSEVNNNPTEWSLQAGKMGGDEHSTKLWWMN